MDWKRKLTSRKFWLAVVEFITMMCLAFGVAESTTAQVTAIIMSGAGIVAYVLGEAWTDANRAENTTINIEEEDEK